MHLHDPAGDSEHRSSRPRMEVEAESVAYLVCAHTGIDTAQYTIPYVAHWSSGDIELVQATAERVIDTARRITDTLERDLAPKLNPTQGPVAPAVLVSQGPGREATDEGALRRPSAQDAVPDGEALASVRRKVEERAAQLLAHLAANPDDWGADQQQHAAIRNAARAMTPAATPEVTTARERLGQLLRQPSAPEPPDPGPKLDAA